MKIKTRNLIHDLGLALAIILSAIGLRVLAIKERGYNDAYGGEVITYIAVWTIFYFRKEIKTEIKRMLKN